MIQQVHIQQNQRIILQRGKEAIIEKIGGEKTPQIAAINSGAITGDTDHSVAETFTIKQKGLFTVIDTCIGMTVLWDNGTRVYLRLTEEFQVCILQIYINRGACLSICLSMSVQLFLVISVF